LQKIAKVEASASCVEPVHNPAIPGVSKASDDSPDDSVDLDHARALAVAAHALVVADPKRARELLRELMRLLDERTRAGR
jgi:hypothetical protein